MAVQKKFRAASIFAGAGSQHVATVSGTQYTMESGDEPMIADGVLMGHSDGVIQTKLSIDTLDPVVGFDARAIIMDCFINKKYLLVSNGLIGGQIHQVEYRIMSLAFDGDNVAGKQTCKIELGGGAPIITN